MKKLCISQDIILLNFYKSLLDDNGIPTLIKNYYLMGASGDVPLNECVPELWIIHDDQFEQAKSLLATPQGSAWQCDCGEKIDGQFFQCFQCGRVKK